MLPFIPLGKKPPDVVPAPAGVPGAPKRIARACEVLRIKGKPAGVLVLLVAAPAVAKKAPAAVGPPAETVALPESTGATSNESALI
jgi:hypothetical protein